MPHNYGDNMDPYSWGSQGNQGNSQLYGQGGAARDPTGVEAQQQAADQQVADPLVQYEEAQGGGFEDLIRKLLEEKYGGGGSGGVGIGGGSPAGLATGIIKGLFA